MLATKRCTNAVELSGKPLRTHAVESLYIIPSLGSDIVYC